MSTIENNISKIAVVPGIDLLDDKVMNLQKAVNDEVETISEKLNTVDNFAKETSKVLCGMIKHYESFLEKYDASEKVQHDIDAAQAELNQQTLSLIEQANEMREEVDEKTNRKIDENDYKYRQRFKWLWIGFGGCGLTSLGTLVLQIIQMCIGG